MDFSDLGKMKEMMGQAKQMQEQMERKLSETVIAPLTKIETDIRVTLVSTSTQRGEPLS